MRCSPFAPPALDTAGPDPGAPQPSGFTTRSSPTENVTDGPSRGADTARMRQARCASHGWRGSSREGTRTMSNPADQRTPSPSEMSRVRKQGQFLLVPPTLLFFIGIGGIGTASSGEVTMFGLTMQANYACFLYFLLGGVFVWAATEAKKRGFWKLRRSPAAPSWAQRSEVPIAPGWLGMQRAASHGVRPAGSSPGAGPWPVRPPTCRGSGSGAWGGPRPPGPSPRTRCR